MEEIPFTLVLKDGVVSGPTHYGSEDNTLICERSVGIVACSIAEQVTVTCRISEVILSVVLMHP